MRRLVTLAAGILLLVGAVRAETPPPEGLAPAVDGWPRAGEPVAVVVHGIHPVHADLDPLAADLAGRGYRVLDFVYDDAAGLDASAGRLAAALAGLVRARRARRVAVVAHSMGGLVARRALTEAHDLGALPARFKLLTLASPFGGFRSANWARWDLGLGPDSHDDLGTRAAFVREPGDLVPNAVHLKIETTEDGRVSLEQQASDPVDAAAVRRYRVPLGHVGVLRDPAGRVPAAVRLILARHLGLSAGRLGPGATAPPLLPPAGDVASEAVPPRRGIADRLR